MIMISGLMKMNRKEELIAIFKGMDGNVLTIVTPMIERLVFIEKQLIELEGKPLMKFHPDDPSRQKSLPAGRLYNQMLAQQKDIVRILCSLVHKGGDGEEESPLDAYFKRIGK